MKLTKSNINKIKRETDNKLIKRVCSYITDRWSDYEDKKYIFTDVLQHGCQSGTVGFLIYYNDTVAFYKRYNKEIRQLLSDIMNDTGIYSMKMLFHMKWDNDDPLASDRFNQNLLAWFGFEETLRNIGLQFESLENCI